MKIGKILGIFLAFAMIISLFACEKDYGNGKVHHSADDSQQVDQCTSGGKITYVYSVTSKNIHRSDCYHAKRINEEYKREVVGDPMDYLDDGYTLCKTCFPPAVDEDDTTEEVEEDPNAIKKEDATYVINTKTLKFHETDCYHAENMNRDNAEYTDLTIEELLELEYIPCGTCLPDEAKKWKELHGDTEK